MSNPLLFREGKKPRAAKSEISGPPLGWALWPNPWHNLAGGAFLIAIAAVLIAHNERMAVQGRQAASAGVFAAIPASANIIFPENEGKFLYVTGEVTGAGAVADRTFGAGSDSAVCLLRKVETNQWVERADSAPDAQGYNETAYSYDARWSEEWIDSSRFVKPGHQNPERKPFPSAAFASAHAALGVFKITPELCALYGSFEPLALTEEGFQNIPLNIRNNLTLWEGALYTTRTPAHPGIGHARIAFYAATPRNVTVLAKQERGALKPARLFSGKDFGAFLEGTEPMQKVFAPLPGWGAAVTIVLRLAGLLVMTAGLMLTLGPLELIISLFPKIHGLLETRPVRTALLAAGGACFWIMTPPWYAYQPLVSGALAAAGGGLLALLVRDVRRTEPKLAPPPSPKPEPIPVEMPGLEDPAAAAGILPTYRPRRNLTSLAAPQKPVKENPAADPGQPAETYKPKKPPSAAASGMNRSAGDSPASVIEQAYVFHEMGRMDKERMADMIRRKEAGPDGMAPKVWGVTGIHASSWPEEGEALEAMIRQGMAAHAKKHPEAARYQDKTAYDLKVWTGKSQWLGRFAAALIRPIRRA